MHHTSDNIRADKEIVLEYAKKSDANKFRHIANELKKDREVIQAFLDQSFKEIDDSLFKALEEYKNDKELMLKAISIEPERTWMFILDPSLKQDEDIQVAMISTFVDDHIALISDEIIKEDMFEEEGIIISDSFIGFLQQRIEDFPVIMEELNWMNPSFVKRVLEIDVDNTDSIYDRYKSEEDSNHIKFSALKEAFMYLKEYIYAYFDTLSEDELSEFLKDVEIKYSVWDEEINKYIEKQKKYTPQEIEEGITVREGEIAEVINETNEIAMHDKCEKDNREGQTQAD